MFSSFRSAGPRGPAWRRGAWPIIAWATALLLFPLAVSAQESPATSALREAVQGSNPELSARRAAVEAARARVAATGFAEPAALSAEVEEVPSGIDLTGASVRVEVGREFLAGGRRDAARALAATDVRAAEASLAAAGAALDAAVLRSLTAAAGWSAISRRLAAEDSLLVGAEEALTSRFSVGEARYVDVLRLRTERLRVQGERAEALAETRAARVALQGLLGPVEGRGALIDAAIAETGPRLVALPSAPDPDSLLARSGAVLAAQVAVERARAGRALTAAEQRPRFSGAVGLQRFGADDGGGSVGLTVGGSMTLPSTARRANQAALASADAEIAGATAELDATVAAVRAELAAALERYESARIRLSAFDAALLRGAREEREAALASFRTGELSLIELLDFERALARAETERLRSMLDAADALADLYAAGTGGPDHEDASRGGGNHDR
ncbi:MAG TPA: TolC family protein [Longimicrobium sp.]|nr:TolC family protein [Longimicrobium sp.]